MASPPRDRDPAGRARNARPRDAAGRPLPRGAASGLERVPDDLVLTADESVTEAQRLLDTDLPFSAHEVLEGAWKAAPEYDKPCWRALAQLAVGLTHAQRGNARGAVSLLERAADGLRRWAGDYPAGVDGVAVANAADALVARIADGGTLDAADLRVRLRP
ncbi:DUF309 domain-containing protein [Pseudonocardia sp. GCM10023141]|uniref:DUF309 domain-containing protein n=1 Tax=Pseudonocardia sp. GCM10023141 TaxID=3252653 RepID=UPI00360928E7